MGRRIIFSGVSIFIFLFLHGYTRSEDLQTATIRYLKSKNTPEVRSALIIGNIEGRLGLECPSWWQFHLRSLTMGELGHLQTRSLKLTDNPIMADISEDKRVRVKIQDDSDEFDLVIPTSFKQKSVYLFKKQKLYAVEMVEDPVKFRLCRFADSGIHDWESIIDVFPIINGGATRHFVDIVESNSSVWLFGSASVGVYCVEIDGDSGTIISKFSVQYLEDGLSFGKERQSLTGKINATKN